MKLPGPRRNPDGIPDERIMMIRSCRLQIAAEGGAEFCFFSRLQIAASMPSRFLKLEWTDCRFQIVENGGECAVPRKAEFWFCLRTRILVESCPEFCWIESCAICQQNADCRIPLRGAKSPWWYSAICRQIADCRMRPTDSYLRILKSAISYENADLCCGGPY